MLAKLNSMRNEESGFTLVELLVVIAILGVLAGVVVFSVAGVQDNSQKSACQTEASTVRAAEEAYYAKTKSYATTWAPLTSGANKMLSSTPTLVAFGSSMSATTLDLAWAGACTTTSGLPATP